MCHSLYNLEVVNAKAYNFLDVAVDPRSDKRIWSFVKMGFKALLKICEKLKYLSKTVSATGTGVMGN